MGMLRSDVSGMYRPEEDPANKPRGNFADEIDSICDAAKRTRRKKDRYGSYDSAGAKGSPAHTQLTRRMSSQKED